MLSKALERFLKHSGAFKSTWVLQKALGCFQKHSGAFKSTWALLPVSSQVETELGDGSTPNQNFNSISLSQLWLVGPNLISASLTMGWVMTVLPVSSIVVT